MLLITSIFRGENMKIIEKILAVLLVLAAIYTFDFYNFNTWIISALLILSGVLGFSEDEKFNESVRRVRLLLLIFFILKLLTTG